MKTSAPFSVSISSEDFSSQTGFFPTLRYARSPRYINPRNGNIRTFLQNLRQNSVSPIPPLSIRYLRRVSIPKVLHILWFSSACGTK